MLADSEPVFLLTAAPVDFWDMTALVTRLSQILLCGSQSPNAKPKDTTDTKDNKLLTISVKNSATI